MTLIQLVANEVIQPPPIPKMFDYPGITGALGGVVGTMALLIVVGKFDPSGGILAISLLITLAFVGVVTFCLFFSIPSDDVTSGVIGGLTAAFGAVVAHWIGRQNGGPPKPP